MKKAMPVAEMTA